MIATASINSASSKMEESGCSGEALLPKQAPTSSLESVEKKNGCEGHDEDVKDTLESNDSVAGVVRDTVAASACAQMNDCSSKTMEDESESSVSALTPEGALILRETPLADPLKPDPATLAHMKALFPVQKLTSATENHPPLDSDSPLTVVADAVSNETPAASVTIVRKAQQRHVKQEVYAACQSILAVLRADPRYVSAARFTEELSVHEVYGQHSLHLALQQVLQQTLQSITHSDPYYYLETFCEAVRRQDVSAAVTGAVLAALHTFVERRFVDGRLDQIAVALMHCAFEETTSVPLLGSLHTESAPAVQPPLGRRRPAMIAQPTTHSSHHYHAPEESRGNSNAEDEQVVLKLLQLCVLTVQTATAAATNADAETCVLSSEQITALLNTCWHVRHKAVTASPLLKQAAAFSAQQIASAVFTSAAASHVVVETRCQVLRNLSNLLIPPTDEDVAIPKAGIAAGSTLHDFVATHALTLLMTVLGGSSGDISFGAAEREILESVVTRDVMALAIRTTDYTVLRHCLRVVFQLLRCLRLKLLKCELEVFLHAVHLRRLDKDSTSTAEEKEVVLDSLLELCYGGSCAPVSLQDLYLNYDCDSVCTNLYEAVIATLARTACPSNWTAPDTSEEARKKSAAIATSEANNISLSASSVQSTASYLHQSLEGNSKGASTSVSLSTTSTHAAPTTTAAVAVTTTTTIANPSKPVQTVTVTSHAPLNHLNRLALEGILSVLDLIGQRCQETESIKSSSSIVAITAEGSLDDNGDHNVLSACFGAEALSEEALQARKKTKNSLAKVVQVFNAGNPDKGEWLKVAVAEGLLGSTKDTKAVAQLLHKASENLEKQRLGIYLSRGPDKNFPFQASVRNSFAAVQDFSGLSFAAGLRKFLSKFRLPGEAQCIDRLMEVFSKEFFEQQCGLSFFKNADAVYVLAFSTIMLNTDLHNPTIKAERRMTKDQFVKNNRGINGGDDISEDYISDLYDQIKGRALQVRPEVGEFMKDNKQNCKTAWEGVLAKKKEIAAPVCLSAGSGKQGSGKLDKAMFLILANSSVHAVVGIFMRSWDDALVVRTLRGLQQIVKLAAYFELDCVVNDVLQVLLPQGRDYIMTCITQDQSASIGADGGASVETPVHTRNPSTSESVSGDEETTIGGENDQLIPHGLLCSSDENGQVDISGSASNRGLLALDSSFILLRKNSTRVTDAWPAFIECLCALRDARALPAGLSDLDDFADSNGKVLPLSSFAKDSQKRLDNYHRSLSDRDNAKQKGWFRSFFRKGKTEDQIESTDDDASASPKGELSVYAKTLLGVAEAADVENIVQMGSSQLPDATIRTLLDVLDAYPFENDPVSEQRAVFTLELVARALLSNRERAEALFMMFLAKFEKILCRVTDTSSDVPAPFVIERIVVTVLRSSIHLYEYPELRPQLRVSLQLLMMTLPRSFVRAISDRMACGLAIILRASFHFFETHKEWSFMADTLDVLANYSSSRMFVFDGIASTVEFALPNPHTNIDDQSLNEDDRPKLSIEACSALSRILTRFVLGFYQGDLSLTVPAMLCLEKVYRRKAEILLHAQAAEDGTEVNAADLISSVPDMELWQNVAVAVYSVCRSPDPDASTEGLQCYRRIVFRTSVDQISYDKWVAIMYLMVNKQPPVIAEVSRGNTFSILGHMLTRVLPKMSHHVEIREDLEELVNQYASLAEENLQQSHRGCLFEKTLQTLTYLSNYMVSDDWDGDKEFSLWASEILLKELEQAGNGGKVVTTAGSEEVEDVSEMSDSVAEDDANDIVGLRR